MTSIDKNMERPNSAAVTNNDATGGICINSPKQPHGPVPPFLSLATSNSKRLILSPVPIKLPKGLFPRIKIGTRNWTKTINQIQAVTKVDGKGRRTLNWWKVYLGVTSLPTAARPQIAITIPLTSDIIVSQPTSFYVWRCSYSKQREYCNVRLETNARLPYSDSWIWNQCLKRLDISWLNFLHDAVNTDVLQ